MADTRQQNNTEESDAIASRPSATLKRPTISDVAKSLGVSTYTVSRALNGHHNIARPTRERVIAAAQRLGYTASSAARTLKSGRSDTVTVLLTPSAGDLISSYFLPVITGLERVLRAANLSLLVAGAETEEAEIDVLRRLIHGKRTDAIIVTRVRKDDPRVAFLESERYLFATLGRSRDNPEYPFVDADYRTCTRLACQWLISKGHRRIALISTPAGVHSSGEHAAGLRDALSEAGLPQADDLIVRGDYTVGSGRALAGELLSAGDPPSAILCGNDEMAAGVVDAAVARGLVVGRDLSVIGCDDTPIAQLSRPQITTFRSSISSYGTLLGEQVLALLSAGHAPSHFIVPELVKRGSTGRCLDHERSLPFG